MTYINTDRSGLRALFNGAYRGMGAPSRIDVSFDPIADAHYMSGRPEFTETLSQWIALAFEHPGEELWVRPRRIGADASMGVLIPTSNADIMAVVRTTEPDDAEYWFSSVRLDPAAMGSVLDGEPPSSNSGDVVVTPLTGWGEGYAEVRPSEESLSRLPARARSFAIRTIRNSDATQNYIASPAGLELVSSGDLPSADELIAQARAAYREALRNRLSSVAQEEEAERLRKIEQHRQKTKGNFEAFVRDRNNDDEAHIMKLPFVPHGLSSSRRWGIEIEHPGARGVQAPEHWDAKGDGSLRSAYDGWVEVQDFEAYEEEREEEIHWAYCESGDHDPRVEIYDEERGDYIYVPNEDYVNPRDCGDCGRITRTVLVEPQTITHRAKAGDCKEFVSPILVSMHSNGLEQLLDDLKGRPTNSSAGVHVHVESDDLTSEQIATLVYGYDILEPILEASYQRDRRDFCERRSVTEVLEAARKAKRKEHFDPYAGGRYRTVNTHALSDHGTIEFRAMGPVYDYEYLVRWAMLLRELVNSVANGAKPKDFAKIKSWDDLVLFIAKFGKEYVRAAVYEMTGETGSQAALSKGKQPVTQSAVDSDLERVLSGEGLAQATAAVNRMAEIIRNLGVNSGALVGVDELAEV